MRWYKIGADKEKEIKDCHNTFLTRMRFAREKRGYTQAQMAEKLGIELVTYRKIEQGKNRKDAAYFINSLAKELDVSADYLVGLTESDIF